jgi:hypothetical protein
MITADASAELAWAKSQSVPLGGWYDVYRSAPAGGAIDYESAVNPSAIEAWQGHGGGPGFGAGPFGRGPFGRGMILATYATPELADGLYQLAVVGYDPAGNAVTPATTTAALALAGRPAPPGVPVAESYDAETDELAVSFDLSRDDADA